MVQKKTYTQINYINKTGATSGAGAAYPSEATEFTSALSEVRVTRSLVLCVCFVDRCLFPVLFPLAIALSVPIRITDYYYPFGIFRLLHGISLTKID